jgi:TolA-binding protein
MKKTFMPIFVSFCIGFSINSIFSLSVMAEKKTQKDVDETELLMQQSLLTMAKVRKATQKADKVVVAKVTALKDEVLTMKEEVLSLKEENQNLQNDNQELKEASSASDASAVPFNILAIVPDSTDRG